jgi:hypothetical protein
MRKMQTRKLTLKRETVRRMESEPLRAIVAALAEIGVSPNRPITSPLCGPTTCLCDPNTLQA